MELGKTEELEIDLLELFQALLARWVLIALVTVIGGLVAFGISKFIMTPYYESTTSIYVLNQASTDVITYSDLQTGSQLTKDYVVLVESRSVMEQAIQQMNLDLTYEELLGKTKVETATDTRMLSITVTDADPYRAKEMADVIRDVAIERIMEVMDIPTVNVVENANLPTKKAGPAVKKYTLIGAMLGFVLVCGLVVLQVLMDDTIKTPDDVEHYLGLGTIGTIPIVDGEEAARRKKKKAKAYKASVVPVGGK